MLFLSAIAYPAIAQQLEDDSFDKDSIVIEQFPATADKSNDDITSDPSIDLETPTDTGQISIFSTNIIDDKIYNTPSVRAYFLISSSEPVKQVLVNGDQMLSGGMVNYFEIGYLLELEAGVNYVEVTAITERETKKRTFRIYYLNKLKLNKQSQFYLNAGLGYFFDSNPLFIPSDIDATNDQGEDIKPESDAYLNYFFDVFYFSDKNTILSYRYDDANYRKDVNKPANSSSHFLAFQLLDGIYSFALTFTRFSVNDNSYSESYGGDAGVNILSKRADRYHDHIATVNYFRKRFSASYEEKEEVSLLQTEYKWTSTSQDHKDEYYLLFSAGTMSEGTDASKFIFFKGATEAWKEVGLFVFKAAYEIEQKRYEEDYSEDGEKRKDQLSNLRLELKFLNNRFTNTRYSFEHSDNSSNVLPYKKQVHGLSVSFVL